MCQECNCQTCTGRSREEKNFRATPEPQEPQSVHERLSDLASELDLRGVPARYIGILNDICDQIDGIDDKVIKLKHQNDALFKELGEISKELY